MGLRKVDSFFGIHSVAAINKTTKVPYGSSTKGNGILKVLKSASVNPNQQLVSLTGGSLSGPVAVERGVSDIQIMLGIKEFPSWIYDLTGWVNTHTASEAAGNPSIGFANDFGSSVKSATTGIASLSTTTAADLKNGNYIIVAASTTTVDVYCLSDIDFNGNGTALSYIDPSLKITSSPLTVTAATPTLIPGTGVSFTGGSGTIGMTAGDTARFNTRRINAGSDVYVLPATPVPIEFEAIIFFQKNSDQDIQYVRAYRCVIPSFQVPAVEKQFAESDLTMMVLSDPDQAGAFLEISRMWTN